MGSLARMVPSVSKAEPRLSNLSSFEKSNDDDKNSPKTRPLSLMQKIMYEMRKQPLRSEGCTRSEMVKILNKKSPRTDSDKVRLTMEKAAKMGKLHCYRRRYKLPKISPRLHSIESDDNPGQKLKPILKAKHLLRPHFRSNSVPEVGSPTVPRRDFGGFGEGHSVTWFHPGHG